MVSKVTIDKAGRIVLPKPMRDELQIHAGDTLELDSSEGSITLRPAISTGQLVKKDGLWVFSSGEPLTPEMVEETTRRIRIERDRQIWGTEF